MAQLGLAMPLSSQVNPQKSINPIDYLAIPTVDAVKKMLSSQTSPVVWVYNESAPSQQPAPPHNKLYLEHKKTALNHLNGIPNADLKVLFEKLTIAQQNEWLKLTNNCRYTLLRLTPSESAVFNIRTFTASTEYGIQALLK